MSPADSSTSFIKNQLDDLPEPLTDSKRERTGIVMDLSPVDAPTDAPGGDRGRR
jgi:hypothetical protein